VITLLEAYKEVTGKELNIGGRGGIVDTGWLVQAGIPAITYGPGEGMLAHRVDEKVELEALVNYCKTLVVFLSKWCGLT
jgi:acetylornithine deacetylase/succinyl-diaminopimelate desuccinylase-like protein